MMNHKEVTSLTFNSLDPHGYKTISTWMKKNIDVTPNTWQHEVLQSRHDSFMLIGSSKCGKSSLLYMIAAYEAMTNEDNDICFVTNDIEKTKQSIANFCKKCQTSKDSNQLTFDNGSKITITDVSKAYGAKIFLIDDEAGMNSDATNAAYRIAATHSKKFVSVSKTEDFNKNANFQSRWWNARLKKFSIDSYAKE